MELLDLCPLETWKSLEDDIRDRSGLNAAAFSIDGIRLIPPAVWPNRLCPEIKANPKGQSFYLRHRPYEHRQHGPGDRKTGDRRM